MTLQLCSVWSQRQVNVFHQKMSIFRTFQSEGHELLTSYLNKLLKYYLILVCGFSNITNLVKNNWTVFRNFQH